MHGLSGSKDELHIKSIATTFVENGYTTVRFDTTNTFGESYGRYEDATLTTYYEDLEDVLKWSKNTNMVREAFYPSRTQSRGHRNTFIYRKISAKCTGDRSTIDRCIRTIKHGGTKTQRQT